MLKKFVVKREHINKGIKISPSLCPLALCFRENYPHHSYIKVFGEYAYIGKDVMNSGGRIELPKECTDFADDFDNNRIVKPFEFEVEIPND